jgi:thioredoxin reductase (NADPH)
VLRLEPRDYHALASVVPGLAKEVGRLAAHRMTGGRGMQGLASERPPPRAIVVGERWDASCSGLRRFLDRNQISFEWLTTDSRRGRRRHRS